MRRDHRTRVAVVGGGTSGEHDVSVASAASICGSLDQSRYDVVSLTIGRDGTWYDRGGRPIGLAGAVHVLRTCDVVLPALHGPGGEDGTLAALCDLAGLPCVGSGVMAGALAMDKWATKLVAEAVGVRTAPGHLVTPATAGSVRCTGPAVVKPVAAGSSLGVSLVEHPADLTPALTAAFAHDSRVLVEEMLVGREIDVAVVVRPDGSHLVSPALEIHSPGLFDHATKYDGSAEFVVPAPLADLELQRLERDALAVVRALDCRGVVRVDFFLTADGWVLNEVNTMPGFTAASQVPRMFAAAGLDYPELLDLLVGDALAAARHAA